MAVCTQHAMSHGLSARVTKAITLSPSSFRKRYRSFYETTSSLASPAPSSTLPKRIRYQGIFELVKDTKTEVEELKIEGTELGSKESEGEEAVPKRQQQRASSVEVTIVKRPLGLGYGEARLRVIELAGEIAPSTFKVASPTTTPAATIAVDEDEFLESYLIGRGQLEGRFTLSVSSLRAWNELRSKELLLFVPCDD
nr:hypothetical protein [Tanacetum cinerariifolium]